MVFRDTIEVKADYDRIATYFKTKLDETYFGGYIDHDQTQLFYFSGFFRRPFSVNMPVVQLNVENKVNNAGRVKIKFKIVDFALIVFGIANGIILFFSIFNLNPDRPNVIPSGVPIMALVLSYGFLLFIYLIELSGFRREIELLELRQ